MRVVKCDQCGDTVEGDPIFGNAPPPWLRVQKPGVPRDQDFCSPDCVIAALRGGLSIQAREGSEVPA